MAREQNKRDTFIACLRHKLKCSTVSYEAHTKNVPGYLRPLIHKIMLFINTFYR